MKWLSETGKKILTLGTDGDGRGLRTVLTSAAHRLNCNTVNSGVGIPLRGVLGYIVCVPTMHGSAGCIFLHLMFSRAKSSISKMQKSHYVQIAP